MTAPSAQRTHHAARQCVWAGLIYPMPAERDILLEAGLVATCGVIEFELGWATVRAVGFPDLLIAAVAEREQVTLLHYDSDYDLIAQVTTQPMQWVVPRGTVP